MPKVVIATTGSLGDLNPMLAIAEQLRALDVDVAIAAPACYEIACHRAGLSFAPIGSTADYVSSLGYTRDMLEDQGFEQFVERLNFDRLDELYEQLLMAAYDADALVAPVHLVPAHLVAEKRGIPYIACALGLAHIRSPAAVGSAQHKRMSAAAARWHDALWKLRKNQRLSRKVLPFTSLLRDATAVLGVMPGFLLSDHDFQTANLDVVGYAEYRQTDRMVQDHALLSFCDADTVAFCFGSFADACDPAHFFEESVAACRGLGLKCVYLSQHVPASADLTGDDVMLRADVAPGAVFPLVGTVVHHGGTGTLMAACKHARPMVITPFFLDQPQHAERMQALIGAEVVSACEYDRRSAARALDGAVAKRDFMSQHLRALLSEYRDGGEPGARRILATLA